MSEKNDNSTGGDFVAEVHTSCGKVFKLAVRDMTNRQLEGLLKHNSDRTDLDPTEIAGLAAMREELARRRQAKLEPAAQSAPKLN
jgi:hypothetical protein